MTTIEIASMNTCTRILGGRGFMREGEQWEENL